MSSYDYNSSGDAAALAFLGIFYLFVFIFAVAFYVIGAFLLMRVFDKAGVQGKWRAWVPVYNYLVFAKLGDVSPWVVLAGVVLNLIPILNYITWVVLVVALIMAAVRVNAKFGKQWPLLLLFILGPLGVLIWLGILAFGSSNWNPAIGPSPWATTFIADKTVWNGIPAQVTSGGYSQPGYYAPGAQAPGAYPPPPAGYTPPAPGGASPPPPAAPGGTTPPPPPAAPGGTTPPPPPPGGPTEPPRP